MKKLLFCLLLAFAMVDGAFAQVDTTWVRRYGIDPGVYMAGGANWMVVDDSGNIFVTGFSVGYFTTIRYSPDGDQVWINKYRKSESNDADGGPIAIDGNQNIYATGCDDSGYVTIRYNYSGDTIWTRSYSGPLHRDVSNALAIDEWGNVFVTGLSWSPGDNNCDIATIKYYSNGDTAWVRRFAGPGDSYDRPTGIAIDESGNVIVVGEGTGPLGTDDYLTIKYTTDGEREWVRYNDGLTQYYDIAKAVVVDDSGYIYVTGLSWYTTMTIKYYPNGDIVWVRNLGSQSINEGRDIALDGEGDIYIAGQINNDFLLIKYNMAGDSLWARAYHSVPGANHAANDVAVDAFGNAYISGVGDSNYMVLKYSPQGVLMWVHSYNGPAHKLDFPTDLAVDDENNVYVTGQSDGIYWAPDYCTIKYYQDCDCTPGDANGDGKINIGDAVYIITFVFRSGPPPTPYALCSGDPNCDQEVNIGDAVYLVNYLQGGPPPCGCEDWLSQYGPGLYK